MGIYGTRDGIFKAKKLQLEEKRLKIDFFNNVVSSATLLKRLDATSTTAYTLGTAIDQPRAVKVVNAVTTTAERAMDLVIKGYDAQGVYQEEIISLSTGTTGQANGNIPFAAITQVVGAVNTKGYGTYGTVDIKMSDKFGLSEYCEREDDVLQLDNWNATTAHTATTGATYISSATFSRTYQTVDVAALLPAGSTIAIKYLSKFQRKRD